MRSAGGFCWKKTPPAAGSRGVGRKEEEKGTMLSLPPPLGPLKVCAQRMLRETE